MYPLTHFLFPFLLGLILTLFSIFNFWQALLVGLIGVFIDLDHLIDFIYIKKDFNLRHAWNNSSVLHRFNNRTFIHHQSGFILISLVVIILLFYNWKYSLILGVSYYSHIFLDYVHVKVLKKKIKFKEFGFSIRLPQYELMIDLILVLLIIILSLLWLFWL